MSFVTVQIGQCGNQLGYTFFNSLDEVTSTKRNSKNISYLDLINNRFFYCNENEEKIARAVLLDTEVKVIKHVQKTSKGSSWKYSSNCFKMQEKGSGNNWAMGFKLHGPVFKEFALNALRKEIEKCDAIQGFLLFNSVAGGSGSGLGSYISEILRDEFPSVSSSSVSVWPFQKGEVTVQAYNAVLSLSSLQNSCDAIFLFENDWLLKLCKQKMGLKDATIWNLNSVVSQQLCNMFLPVENNSGVDPCFNDILAHLVPHPQFKLIGLRSVPQEPLSSLPFSSYSWPGLLRSLRRMLLYNTVIDEAYVSSSNMVSVPPYSLANLLILRGQDCNSADIDVLHKSPLSYAKWISPSSRLKVWTDRNPFLSYNKTALLANNGQLSVSCVDLAAAKAWKMFTFKAYFHHYEEYGLSKEDFLQSMMTVEQIVSSYKGLSS